MKIKVLENRDLIISRPPGTQHENDYEEIDFVFPESFAYYNKKIVFILPIAQNNIVWDIIQYNQYKIKTAISQYKSVKFYIWVTHNTIDFRSKTYELNFYDNVDAASQVTPEEISGINTALAELDEALTETNNLDIDATKVEHTATITITKKDGTSKSVNILDGDKGETGDTGNGISSIEKISTSGLVDTYKINYTNGNSDTFDVTNGYNPERGKDYWTQEDKQEIDNDIENKLSTYFNKPFINFSIVDGNLIAEVEEYVNNN